MASINLENDWMVDFSRGHHLREDQSKFSSPRKYDGNEAKFTANTVMVVVSTLTIKAVSPTTFDDKHVLSSNSSLIVENNNLVHYKMSCAVEPELLEEIKRLRKENTQLNHEMSQLKSFCNNILTLLTNYGSGFSCRQLESSAGDVNVSVSEGKAPKLLPTKHVSSTDDIVHVDGAAGFLPCTMVNRAEVEVPKLVGVSIGLKRCRTECKVESKGDQMQTRAQTQAET